MSQTPSSPRVVVIGAGIVGLATARELLRRRPDAQVVVLDKESGIARHQTSHNSGVVHAGLYYPAGSLKAQLCTSGRLLLKEFCAEHGVPFEECGKLVVATTEEEAARLRAIEARACANGVPGLRRLGAGEIAAVEPHARGVAALHSPHTAIVDFGLVAAALSRGLDVRCGFEVTALRGTEREVVVAGSGGEVAAEHVIVCAGLQADRVARLAGDGPGPAIVPFRGEYWRLAAAREHLVRGLIYPVPDPAYPFLGVHFTRRAGGGVDVGPNAVLALSREGYRLRDVSLADVASVLGWRGFRCLARRHWSTGLREMWTSVSKRAFAAAARAMVPEVRASDLLRGPTGVRAQAVDSDGTLVDDFRIGWAGAGRRVMAVRNAPSPAATSALAIAGHLAGQLWPDT